jgi:Zn-dependent protease
MNEKFNGQQVLMLVFSLAFWWMLLGSVEKAAGFLALLFVHEMGHVLAARQKNLAVSMPSFTPFGAQVVTEQARSASDEAYVKLAGPILGGLASVIVLGAGSVLGSQMMLQLGYYATLLNLFNLIPLDPMDGGGVTQAVSKWFWIPGVLLFAYFMFGVFGGSPINLIFGFMIAMQSYQMYQQREQERGYRPSYYRVNGSRKVTILASYAVVAGALGWVVLNLGDFLHFVALAVQ